MADERLREAERAWKADPHDPDKSTRYDEIARRAGVISPPRQGAYRAFLRRLRVLGLPADPAGYSLPPLRRSRRSRRSKLGPRGCASCQERTLGELNALARRPWQIEVALGDRPHPKHAPMTTRQLVVDSVTRPARQNVTGTFRVETLACGHHLTLKGSIPPARRRRCPRCVGLGGS